MSTLYANFHHDRHRQTAGQHIQPEKKPRAVQMHAGGYYSSVGGGSYGGGYCGGGCGGYGYGFGFWGGCFS